MKSMYSHILLLFLLLMTAVPRIALAQQHAWWQHPLGAPPPLSPKQKKEHLERIAAYEMSIQSPTNFHIQGLQSFATNHCVIWSTVQHAIATTNGGTTWRYFRLPGNFMKYRHVGFLDRDVGWCSGSNTMFRTLNGGRSWEALAPRKKGIDIGGLGFLETNTVCLIDDEGTWISYDGGVLWDCKLPFACLGIDNLVYNRRLGKMWWMSTGPLAAADSATWYYVHGWNETRKILTFTPLCRAEGPYPDMVLSPSGNVWCLAGGVIRYSQDYCRSWQQTKGPSLEPDSRLLYIDVPGEDDCILALSTKNAVRGPYVLWHRRGLNTEWEMVSTVCDVINDMRFPAPKVGWLVAEGPEGFVYRTFDGGQSWVKTELRAVTTDLLRHAQK